MSYTLKTRLAAPVNYGGSRAASAIKYLVIHYTGNDGDSDENNAIYFINNDVKASAHYFVDDDSVAQSVPDLRVAWSVGGSKWSDCEKTGGGTMHGIVTNYNSISVELCDTKRDGVYMASEATLSNAVELCQNLMAAYDIPTSNVYRHFDVTGKHCPAYMMNAMEWRKFKNRLEGNALDNTPREFAEEAVEWAKNNGILLGDTNGDLRLSGAVSREELMVFMHRFSKHISEHMSKL